LRDIYFVLLSNFITKLLRKSTSCESTEIGTVNDEKARKDFYAEEFHSLLAEVKKLILPRERERERERYFHKINFFKHDCQRFYKILYFFYFLETFILLNFLSYDVRCKINCVLIRPLVLYSRNKSALFLFLFID